MNKFNNPPRADWPALLRRPQLPASQLEPLLEEIFTAVQTQGDAAVQAYSERFDKTAAAELTPPVEAGAGFAKRIAPDLREAICQARDNITRFHAAQRPQPVRVETCPGVQCWREPRPIERVGLYVPGGSAALFSSVLMQAVPAALAGCQHIVLCSPPDQNGRLPELIHYTAWACGVTHLVCAGGIQAIAGLTFGTQSIPKVDKLFGPGNPYVTAAKQHATRFGVGQDLPAGPSELLVIADVRANPDFIAADLLSQAEHGADSQVILLALDALLADEVAQAMMRQLEALPRRDTIAEALQHARLIHFPQQDDALAFANAYAPEHCLICAAEEQAIAAGLKHAGSVFIGEYTPVSAGDYASGTNHTLPTGGQARHYAGIGLESFMKSITFQRITAEGLQGLGPTIACMAQHEGLDAHEQSVRLRLNTLAES